MRSRSNARHAGFTLIELLVVISIIGILVSLLTVAVMGVRHRAKEEKTTSALKRYEAGINLYVARFNRVPPACPIGSDTDGSNKYSSAGLANYINSAALHYWLGSSLLEFSGFDSAGVAHTQKRVPPLIDFQKSEVSTWDSMATFPVGRFDVTGVVADAATPKAGILLDSWGRGIAYVATGIDTTAAPFARAGSQTGRPGRNLTGACMFWSRGLDGVTQLPAAGPPAIGNITSATDSDGDGRADNLDDLANWFLPYY